MGRVHGEEEREAFIKNAVLRVQEEALMLSNRAKEEEMKRLEYIRLEEERIKKEDLHMKITSSQFNVGNAKTRQQLEEEREAFIKNAVLRVQEEALMLSNRAKEEEMKRLEYIRLEEERIKKEDKLRAE